MQRLQSKPFARWAGVLAGVLTLGALVLAPLASMAQPMLAPATGDHGAPAWQGAAYNLRQLDQMLAPVALYPDTLLAQILLAATFADQVADAARWSRANPGLQGDYAVQAVLGFGWDPSVQSLVAFPQVLAQMEASPDWVRSLGEAFLAQEPQVIDAVQDLRRRAQAAGTLRSDDQVLVEQDGPILTIAPAQPLVTYVPYYDPLVAYGRWPWSAYPPVYWAPWAGYRVRPGYRGFAWGPAIAFRASPYFGGFDWHHRRVHPVAIASRVHHRAPATSHYAPPEPSRFAAQAAPRSFAPPPSRPVAQAASPAFAPAAPRSFAPPPPRPVAQTVSPVFAPAPRFAAPPAHNHWRADLPMVTQNAAHPVQPAPAPRPAPAQTREHGHGHGNGSRGENAHVRGEGRRRG